MRGTYLKIPIKHLRKLKEVDPQTREGQSNDQVCFDKSVIPLANTDTHLMVNKKKKNPSGNEKPCVCVCVINGLSPDG